MERCTIDAALLAEIITSLGNMIDYADDGMVNRNDPDFAHFFEEVDGARNLLDKLQEKYLKLTSK